MARWSILRCKLRSLILVSIGFMLGVATLYILSSYNQRINRSITATATTEISGIQPPPKVQVLHVIRNSGQTQEDKLAPIKENSLDQVGETSNPVEVDEKGKDDPSENIGGVLKIKANGTNRESSRKILDAPKGSGGKTPDDADATHRSEHVEHNEQQAKKGQGNEESESTNEGNGDGNSQPNTNPKENNSKKAGNQETPQASELHYTIEYKRAENTNTERLFSYDDQGKCQDLACKWPQMPGATKELVKWAPEIFEKVPLHFSDNFKNPCWVRGESGLNCLPYFYVIGMYKCGTTDIWDKLVAHPDVVSVPKEPHWWGPRRLGYTNTPIHRNEVLHTREITGGHDDSSLEWYLNLYKSYGLQTVIDSNHTTPEGIPYHPRVFGDSSISTSYTIGLDWTKTYPNASEPLYTTADLIRAVQPNAKIILMVRDPTARANSYYWYTHYGQQFNSETWHHAASKNIHCLQECIKKHNVRYCAYASNCPYNMIPELQVGMYHVFLRDWMNAFSRDGVLVVRLEDWQADELSVYRKILKFLDLRQLNDEEENRIIHRAIQNANRRSHGDMLPQTKKLLDDFYRPHNQELAKLMNDDKFLYPSS